MYLSGYHNITNIDISDVVIEKMKSEYNIKLPELKCIPCLNHFN